MLTMIRLERVGCNSLEKGLLQVVEGGVGGAGDAGDGSHGLQRYDAQQLRPRVLKCGERSMRNVYM